MLPQLRSLALLAALTLAAGSARAADAPATIPADDTPQKIADDFIADFKTIDAAIAAVTDVDSANTAAAAMKAAGPRNEAYVARMAKFPDPPKEVMDKFSADFNTISTHIRDTMSALNRKDQKAMRIVMQANTKYNDFQLPAKWVPKRVRRGGRPATQPAN